MSEPTIADLARALDDIAKKIHRNTDCPFTGDDIEQIKRGAQIVEWFDTAGWLGKRVLALTGGIVLLISQWERIVQFFGGAR